MQSAVFYSAVSVVPPYIRKASLSLNKLGILWSQESLVNRFINGFVNRIDIGLFVGVQLGQLSLIEKFCSTKKVTEAVGTRLSLSMQYGNGYVHIMVSKATRNISHIVIQKAIFVCIYI